MVDISRRSALISMGAVCSLFATGSVAKAAQSEERMRPPTVADESKFLTLCVRCQRCINVCHAHIIQTVSIADGLAAMGTPEVSFLHGYCDFCEEANGGIPRCALSCPTGALSCAEEKPTVSALPKVSAENCIAFSGDACRVCIDLCPQHAIEPDDFGRPSIVFDACDGCGRCELECPSVSIGNSSLLSGNGKGIVLRPRNSVLNEDSASEVVGR